VPLRAPLAAILLLAALLSPAPAVAQDAEEPELFASDSVTHVANLPYDLAYPDVESLPYGTDIEFAELSVGGTPDVRRLAGTGRVATAVAVSADTFEQAETALVATGGVFADALAAAPLAADLDAPVLLSTADALSPETAEEIERLGAGRVVLLGGEAALAPQVEQDLTALGVEVERIGGANRFATAALIAERLGVDGEVLLAEGERADPEQGWQGALSASALGAVHRIPLLLVNAERLPAETAALLEGVDVTVVGGEAEVPPALQAEVDAIAEGVTRVGGDTPAATSAAAAAESVERGADGTDAYVATTRAFPDGLVSGAAVGATGGVLLLVDGQGLAGSPESLAALEAAGLRRLRIAGGVDAVAEDVGEELAALVEAEGETRSYAIAGTEFNGMQIVDITDPESAEIASVYDCGVLQGDVQVFTQGDRTFATYTSENTTALVLESRCVQDAVAAGDVVLPPPAEDGTQDESAAYGTYVVEITDPLDPVYGGFIPVVEGSHNGTVHPSGEWFYNSDSALITDVTPQIQVYDLRDLSDIERVATVDLPTRPGLGTSSHDITFNQDGTRMYSAALSQTVILDATDPALPVVITSFEDPAINVEHQADPVTVTAEDGTERELLIVEDELAGAAGNGLCPGGGMHIYDITGDNELNPMLNKVGTYFIPEFRPAGTGSGQGESITCTAHVFDIIPEAEVITIAWYNAGVWVLDISDLADAAQNPLSEPIRTAGFAYFSNSDTWAFKTNRVEEDGSFYGYGNDIARGLDVYRFDPSAVDGGEAMPQGVWTPAAAQQPAAPTASPLMPRCLLRAESA
jgi:hypothetical protein